jgi:hypothetical protein
MKFIYQGCEGAPEVSTHFGVEFTIGQPAEVTDPAVIAKLSGHPHFVKAGERAAPVAVKAPEPAAADEPKADPAPAPVAAKKAGGKRAAE